MLCLDQSNDTDSNLADVSDKIVDSSAEDNGRCNYIQLEVFIFLC